MGSTVRSAKMKATTPPKLIPPFHRTAASGMFPTEHTKEIIATKGPTIGPQNLDKFGCAVRKKERQNRKGFRACRQNTMRASTADSVFRRASIPLLSEPAHLLPSSTSATTS